MRAYDLQSRQVCWWSVHEYVTAAIERTGINDWPAPGTPAWRSLDDDDPRKLAALLTASSQWVLRIETEQELRAQASRDIADAVDWSAVAKFQLSANGIRIPRKVA
jgi:hypothetical protein